MGILTKPPRLTSLLPLSASCHYRVHLCMPASSSDFTPHRVACRRLDQRTSSMWIATWRNVMQAAVLLTV
jgi:hypothetical protein